MAGRPRALGAIAAEGDRLATLEALRNKIARAVDNPRTLARDLAALSRQLVQITAEIEEMQKTKAPKVQATPASPQGQGVTSLDRFREELEEKRQAATN